MFGWLQDHLFGIVWGVFALIFGGVGLLFIWLNVQTQQETAAIEALPLRSLTEMAALPNDAPVALEGRISERNQSQHEGLAAYVQDEYRGLECDDDDDGGCRERWTEVARVTPALWLDLADGRLRLRNSDYQLLNPPESWESMPRLIENETQRFAGFRLGSPVFVGGVINTNDGVTLEAEFLSGGNRADFLAAQREESSLFFWLSLVFCGFGLFFGIIGLGLTFLLQ